MISLRSGPYWGPSWHSQLLMLPINTLEDHLKNTAGIGGGGHPKLRCFMVFYYRFWPFPSFLQCFTFFRLEDCPNRICMVNGSLMAQHSHLKELSVNAQTEEPGDHDAEPNLWHTESVIFVQLFKPSNLRRFLWMFCGCLMFLLSILSLLSLQNRFFSLHCALFIAFHTTSLKARHMRPPPWPIIRTPSLSFCNLAQLQMYGKRLIRSAGLRRPDCIRSVFFAKILDIFRGFQTQPYS